MSAKQEIDRQCLQMATEELQKKQGAEFDKCYMGKMIAGHGQMMATLKGLQNQASPQLQQILTQGADTTHQHHEMAKQIMERLEKGDGASRAAARPAQSK